MVSKTLFSSRTQEWETPPDLFVRLNNEFEFVLDPAATNENALCPIYFTKKEDGLKQPWVSTTFLNPPYGRRIGAWTAKCVHESSAGGTIVVALLPARTDTIYWHRDIMQAYEIRFIKGRLRFGCNGEQLGPAPFPSVVVIWDYTKGLNLHTPLVTSLERV